MKVLSLFDGMACGMIAFKELGIPIERYVAYEIDKFAVKTATHNFSQIEEMGDVFAADFNEYRGFDWLIGGSPCTYWSIAQKNNRETEASGIGWELLSQYVRALNEAKPKYFLYENNKSMSNAIRESITETFGFEPVLINSALVSAQNRQRLYWVGKRNESGTYSKIDVLLPKDRGVVLADILENGQDLTKNEKSFAVTTGIGRACPQNTIERHQRNMVATPARAVPLEYNLLKSCDAAKIYNVVNKMILINDKWYPCKLDDGYYDVRYLTVREVQRLQTVPDWYEFPVSKTQAYKMLGNGWTVDVIKHLITSAYSRPVVNWTKQITFDELV